jgi:hypothetical protein
MASASPVVRPHSAEASASRRRIATALVAVTSLSLLFLGSVVLDRAIGVLTPANPVSVAHPPNFQQRRHSSEFTTDFRTNSQGLRYRELSLTKSSPEEFRVFVAGDSMTEGWGVESEQTFSALLENSLSTRDRPVDFINGGLSGTGPLEYGRILAVVGLKYHPDLALIVLHPNDLFDTLEDADLNLVPNRRGEYQVWTSKPSWPPGGLIHKTAYFLWPWSYVRLQRAVKHQDIVNLEQRLGLIDRVKLKARGAGIPESQVRSWIERLPAGLVDATNRGDVRQDLVANGLLFPDDLIQQLDIPSHAAELSWTSMRRVLGQIVALCRRQGIQVAVVYTPTAAQYDETIGALRRQVGGQIRRAWLTGQPELERRLTQWATESNVPFLSLTPAFRDAARVAPGTFNYPLDEHWTPAGHRVAARALSAWLTDRALIPSSNAVVGSPQQ